MHVDDFHLYFFSKFLVCSTLKNMHGCFFDFHASQAGPETKNGLRPFDAKGGPRPGPESSRASWNSSLSISKTVHVSQADSSSECLVWSRVYSSVAPKKLATCTTAFQVRTVGPDGDSKNLAILIRSFSSPYGRSWRWFEQSSNTKHRLFKSVR